MKRILSLICILSLSQVSFGADRIAPLQEPLLDEKVIPIDQLMMVKLEDTNVSWCQRISNNCVIAATSKIWSKIRSVIKNPVVKSIALTTAELGVKTATVFAVNSIFHNSVITGFALHSLADSLAKHFSSVPFILKAGTTYGIGYCIHLGGAEGSILAEAAIIAFFLYMTDAFDQLNPSPASKPVWNKISTKFRQKFGRFIGMSSEQKKEILSDEWPEAREELLEIVDDLARDKEISKKTIQALQDDIVAMKQMLQASGIKIGMIGQSSASTSSAAAASAVNEDVVDLQADVITSAHAAGGESAKVSPVKPA